MRNSLIPMNDCLIASEETFEITNKGVLSHDRRAVLKGGALATIGTLLRSSTVGTLARAMPMLGIGAASASAAAATTRVFTHPGLLHTAEDFARIAANVDSQVEPWLEGWSKFLADGYSQLGSSPRPLAVINRAAGSNTSAQMYIDIHRAYQLAIRWKVTQDTRYAEAAVIFLNAWASTLKAITGDADRYLAAGIYGYQFANAAEIMRDYAGWAAADFLKFQQMMLTVFYPLSSLFLKTHNDAVITNYWANWDQCSMACILAVGVLCDRVDIYNEAMDYYKFGQGNGSSLQSVYYVHPGYLGQWQESGRDQGHCTLGISLAAAFCEMSWNQGDDMYGYDNNRFLAGAEYVAKSNLTDSEGAYYTLPWFTYADKQGTFPGLSLAGRVSFRPTWECIYNHYAGRKGIATRYVGQMAQQMRPEGNDRTGDQLGFGTLMFSRPLQTASKPSGVTAYLRGDKVVISWWGINGATSYAVKRSTSLHGTYTEIAANITDLLTYEDTFLSGSTTLYYKVATLWGGTEVVSDAVTVYVQPVQLYKLSLDEGKGTSTRATVGLFAPATLVGGATWGPGVIGAAVLLNGVDGYLNLPDGIIDRCGDFTIDFRCYIDSIKAWERLFDFGSGARHWMMLTPKGANGLPTFGMATVGNYTEQTVIADRSMPVGKWFRVAITLRGNTCILYFDGVEVGSNTDFTLAPCNIGPATSSYLGKSQYNDPYLNGRFDYFKIWSAALTPVQINAMLST